MNVDPVATASDFAVREFPERLWFDPEQKNAQCGHGRPGPAAARVQPRVVGQAEILLP